MSKSKKNKQGMLITNNPETVANWITQEKIAVLPFGGGRMFGMFSSIETEALELMARMKGRAENKPFVITTHTQFIDNIVNHAGVSKEISERTKSKIARLLQKSSERHPIGLLLPANKIPLLSNRLIGTNPRDNGFRAVRTIGFMVSGPDRHYQAIISQLKKYNYFVAGTSMNRSGDEKSRGSGHHKLAGVLAHFGHEEDLCVYHPNDLHEGDGTSTTILYIENDNEVYIVRIGSLSKTELTDAVKYAEFKEIKEPQVGTKHILPYDYTIQGKTFSWILKHHISRKMKTQNCYRWDSGGRIHKIVSKLI